MKCQICGKETDWDSSVGLEEFIVCNSCDKKLHTLLHATYYDILKFIFACGQVRRDIKNSNEK